MQDKQNLFTTSKAHLNVQTNFMSVPQFMKNITIDLVMITLGIILWKLFWHSLNKLRIRNIKTAQDDTIGTSKIIDNIKALHRLLKQITIKENSYIIQNCGFQAYSYLFFLRRFCHLMAIFIMTDLFVWVPYLFIFNQNQSNSLISADSSNYLFRTFYTIWITVCVLYGVNQMKSLLRLTLKNRLFRNSMKKHNIINSIKTKTVFVHFKGQNRKLDILEIKTRLVQRMRVQDTIIGIIQIPNNSKKIQVQYFYKIYLIAEQLGLQNFNAFWHFLKKAQIQQVHSKLLQKYKIAYIDQNQQDTYLNCFLVAFQNINTALQLIHQVDSAKGCCDFLPDNSNQNQVQNFYFSNDYKLDVRWAQQPSDIMWRNIGASQKVKIVKYVLFNVLSGVLIALGIVIVFLARSKTIVDIPRVILPFMVNIINSSLRWLISKSSQWQNQHFQSQYHIKQMKVLVIFFALNVIGASVVRDTLNLVDILKTGWGFIQLFGLFYKQPDGLFFYSYLCNQMAFHIFGTIGRFPDLFSQVFQSNFWWQKNIKIKLKSKFATNNPFRFGFSYSYDIIVFAVIFMYSASAPLLHIFGFGYFFVKLYSTGYTICIFHRQSQTSSNLRILQKVCEYIVTVMLLVVLLLGITMMFERQYACVLILYFWEGVLLWLIWKQKNQNLSPLKDYYIDDLMRHEDLTQHIRDWRNEYIQSWQTLKKEDYVKIFNNIQV